MRLLLQLASKAAVHGRLRRSEPGFTHAAARLLLLCLGIHAAIAAFCVPLFQVDVTFAFVSAETIHPVHLVSCHGQRRG
jgi:hypothetical protein